MKKLNVNGAPLPAWSVREGLKDLGLSRLLEQGSISVADDGTVTVRGPNEAVEFHAPLTDHEDLELLRLSLGDAAAAGHHLPTPAEALDLFGQTRAAGIENRVNARVWLGSKLSTDLRDEFIAGRRFTAPVVEIPAHDAVSFRADVPLQGLDELHTFFCADDGRVLLPMHPQELEARPELEPTMAFEARCGSSERTVHAQLPGIPNALVKLDLASVKHAAVHRPLGVTAGRGAVMMTEFLMKWSDTHLSPQSPLCFLPEPFAVGDASRDLCAIVRCADPYPPPADGQQTWVVPVYSLTAPDPDVPDQPPMLIRLVDSRPDKAVSALRYALDAVVQPLIDSALAVYLDLGSSAQAHGQNTSLEIGEDGRPTGRVAHSDLEAFWPHPELAGDLKRPDFFANAGLKHQVALESSVSTTFEKYFVEGNLGPIAACLAQHLGLRRDEVMSEVNKRIRAGVSERAELVRKYAQGPLAGFVRYL